MLILERLTEAIIGAAIEDHKVLGPGLLESAYEECLGRELALRQLAYRRQVPLPVTFKGERLDCSYRLDIVVEKSVILELKAVERLLPIHEAQLMTYLRLSGLRVGLILNFRVPVMPRGTVRRVL